MSRHLIGRRRHEANKPENHHRLPVLQGVLPLERSRFSAELIAGTTLEVTGYANIAQVPVVLGLYTILVPIAVFALLGSSRHLVVGADSATAAIMAAGLVTLATPESSQFIALAAATALITRVVLIIARIIRLGFLADFLSGACWSAS